ncbi:MAG: biotin/lipoyl-binding protein, partial [Alcanivorax sp.]|nr:biotin/lipoyl-binding protein [Alcanivorax sp.]
MSKETIRVPDVGSSDPVDVIEVSVKKGDSVEAEDTIVVLESDKASVEVPCPKAGTVLELLVKAGDRVKEGDPLLELDTEAGDESGGSGPAREESAGSENDDKDAGDKEAKDDSGSRIQDTGEGAGKASDSGETREQTIPAPDLGDIDEAEIIELSVSEGDAVEAEQTILVLESDKASLEIPSPAAGTVKKLLVKTGDKITSGTELMVLETTGGGEETADEATAGEDKSAGKQSGESGSGESKPGGSGSGGSGPAREASEKASQPSETSAQDSGAGVGKDSGGIGEHPAKSGAAAAGRPSRNVHAGPAVRKLARETGVDLGTVPPSGPKDRILKEDVHAHIKQRMEQPAAAGGAGALDLPEIDFSEFGPV